MGCNHKPSHLWLQHVVSPFDRWLVSIQCEMVVQIVFVCHLGYAVSIADAGEIHRGPLAQALVTE